MLAALQQAFRDAVLSADDGAIGVLVEVPRGRTATRIAVYRNTVQGSLAEVLAAAFPVVSRIVGPGFFDALARHFAVTTPPRVPQLSAYGDGFADFISAESPRHGLAYLADVARLEWARGQAYFAADLPILNPLALAAVAPEAMDGVRFRLHPATNLIRSPFPIHRIWKVNQPAVTDVPAVDMTRPENVLISRAGAQVFLRQVSDGDAAFVTAIGSGKTLGEAAAEAVTAEPAFNLEAALRDHLIGGTFKA